jgi:Right handed beta helix region
MSILKLRRPAKALLGYGAAFLVIVLALVGVRSILRGSYGNPDNPAASRKGVAVAIPAGMAVCGKPILDSPYDYDGAPGPYASGTPGLPTYGKPGTDFPKDDGGVIIPLGKNEYQNWQLSPNTVYYLLPGTHVGSFSANTNDSFVGGLSDGKPTILSGGYKGDAWGIDSDSSMGDQPGVTIEYLTIEKYLPPVDQGAINQDTNTGWTISYNTITLNVPGAGAMLGSDNTLKDNCMTLNGQYGFQSPGGYVSDPLTGGAHNILVQGNEISYNDTCDLEGTLSNSTIHWHNYNPVPAKFRNPECGDVSGDGDQGGFKLWQTNGVTIKENYIHDNWGPGGWADTDNANTNWTGNTITNNDGAGIIEEISYNFSITNNLLVSNNAVDGLGNPGFPSPAIYISESGSDTRFGGVPACSQPACSAHGHYISQSVIRDNQMVDNGGNIFLWQNSNRYCSDQFDNSCTLVDHALRGPFTKSACNANLPSAALNTATYVGDKTGSPPEDWYDGCMWKTENVEVTRNVIDFNPADLPHCNKTDWPACGAGGIFSEYGGTRNAPGEWATATDLTFFQGNHWSDNTYNGPSTFWAWNQGNGDNPVTWQDWVGDVAKGDKCSSPYERQSGYCTGPFGQDAGSTYNSTPPSLVSSPPAPDTGSTGG